MKTLWIFLIVAGTISGTFAQVAHFKHNPGYQGISSLLSHDGKFVALLTAGVKGTPGCQLLIEETSGNRTKRISFNDNAVYEVTFSSDDRQLYYRHRDSLLVLSLVHWGPSLNLGPVVSWSTQGRFLAFRNKDQRLSLSIAGADHPSLFSNVKTELFAPKGTGALLQTVSDSGVALHWYDLRAGADRIFWRSSDKQAKISRIIFSPACDRVAFALKERGSGSIWQYRPGDTSARLLAEDHAAGFPAAMVIDDDPIWDFTTDGRNLLFYIRTTVRPLRSEKMLPDITLWNYTDPLSMSYQKSNLGERNYLMSIGIDTHRLTRLENDNEFVVGSLASDGRRSHSSDALRSVASDHHILVAEWTDSITTNHASKMALAYRNSEWNWNRLSAVSLYLRSLDDTSKKLIKGKMLRGNHNFFPDARMSPSGRYVVYLDEGSGKLKSYQIDRGRTRDISSSLPVSLLSVYRASSDRYTLAGILSWLPGDRLLLKDQYTDLWKVDPGRREPAYAITGGYFRKRGLCYADNDPVFYKDSTALLLNYLIDSRTGKEGFATLSLVGRPRSLRTYLGSSTDLIKKNEGPNDVFLEQFETPAKPPSLSAGNAPRMLHPLAFLNERLPVRASRPINRRVLSWKTFDGFQAFGVLYEPPNFDPRKKYPVIIAYYEGNFQRVNEYEGQGFVDEDVITCQLPYDELMKRGYLYFVVDIRYLDPSKTGGEMAYDYVVSGTKVLMKLPFVDPKAIAIMGHSMGGVETNYIVSHSHLYAGAFSSAGYSDYISLLGQENPGPGGYPDNGMLQPRLPADHLLDLKRLMANSAVYQVVSIRTPLLLEANPDDTRVPAEQGIELFQMMRRFGKPCWLLQEPGMNHGVGQTGREMIFQFFGHYLKGEPAPIWMTRGIPDYQKGTTLGEAYDTTVKTPGPSLLIPVQSNHSLK